MSVVVHLKTLQKVHLSDIVTSAYRAAIVYSLMSTCKAVDVDPRTWMEDVLKKIPYYQRDQRDRKPPVRHVLRFCSD